MFEQIRHSPARSPKPLSLLTRRAGERASLRGPLAERGITLIELMLTLAVIGVMFAVVSAGLNKVNKTELRDNTVRVASSLRAAFNMATLSGVHHRVVFDLDKQVYRIEACPDNPKLYRTDVEEVIPDPAKLEELFDKVKQKAEQVASTSIAGGLGGDVSPGESPEALLKAAAALEGLQIGTARCAPPTLPTGDADGRGAIRNIDNAKVKIRRIHVAHLEDPITSGSVSINFFPMGSAEKAVIEIGSERETEYYLLVHRLTGQVELKQGDYDPDHHMRRDGAGDDDEGDKNR